MSHYLPPQVMAFFAPRPPLPFAAPLETRRSDSAASYEGVAPYTRFLAREMPAPAPVVSRAERKLAIAEAREEETAARIAQGLETCTYSYRGPKQGLRAHNSLSLYLLSNHNSMKFIYLCRIPFVSG